MACCHYFAPSDGGDGAFSVEGATVAFGAGVLNEAGDHAAALGLRRVALMTDKVLAGLPHEIGRAHV